MITTCYWPKSIDGIEPVWRAKSNLPEVKVLFITGFAAAVQSVQKTGANRHAMVRLKPFHRRELLQEVERFLQDEAA